VFAGQVRLAYREAHIPYAAAEAVDDLVSALGLRPAPGFAPEPGIIVFVYRPDEVHQVTKGVAYHAAAT